jgi:PEGA domain
MRLASLLAFFVVLGNAAPEAAAQSEQPARGGIIRVLSNVERAIVTLDGTDVGVTPLEIKQVRPGEHVVAVRAQGHGRREDRVMVEAGATAVVTLDLEGGGEPVGVGAVDPAGGDRGRRPRAPRGGGAAPGASAGGEIAARAPSAKERALERRALSALGARALDRGHSTVSFGAGYPYLFDARVQVGAMKPDASFGLDAGVLFRTYGARWELGAGARATLVDVDPFSLGGFFDFGGGSTYFDDSKRNYYFTNLGVAMSLTGLGAVSITGRAYLNAWSDRHCPGQPDEGDPTDLCLAYRDGTLDADSRARVDQLVGDGNIFDRDGGVRGMLSLAVELALSDAWNGWLVIEGAPRQDERAAYTDLFHGIMLEEDARTYARVGFSYKF